jgi:CheY-like chemotaxis protein/anti-sigma regulatory factor (Ser/Thr protein kinase)
VRVVVADGDPDYRLLVRLALEPDGRFSVVGEAASGSELVAAVETGAPDLAFIAADMGGGAAFDALPHLRRLAPGCRIILVSSHGADDLQRAARAAGAVGYLRKDTAASRLADEVWALTALVGAVSEVLVASSTRFGADLRSAREARRFVTSALDDWGIGDVAEVVTLLVSELVTNAIVHAESEVDVVVQLTPEVARVEVSDTSEAEPVIRPTGQEDESGRGLAIVDSFSRAWGVRPRHGGGKTIWFEVVRPGVSAAS